ncbi:MAG: hypothetical protein NT023_05925 [Armatimonadetes bacterium]|nr:hypothetical protein [Armatimonadota bacterium]
MQTLETLPDKDTRVLADSVCKYPFFLAQMSTIDETPRYIRPDQAYLPRAFTGTSDLETYFANNTRQFVDAGYIRAGDEVSRWCAAFKKIGVSDVPRRIQHDELSWNIKVQLYSGIGHTTDIATTNWNLDGLTEALKRITTLSDTSLPTALALWRLLVRMLPRDKTEQYRFLSGEYRWQYYSVRSKFFDSTFYTQLITTAWLPDESGNFQLPATLFAASAETRNVMGDSVRYLHPDLEIKEATSDSPARLLAECLGANLAPKTEEVIKRLQGLSGQAIDLKTVENIYRFLQRQSMTGRQALFKQQPLLYTSTPIPRWWTADKVFWDNERAIFGDERGYLTAQYSEALKPFFVSQGVTLSATFADYVTAVLETAARAEVTDNILTRMNSLYRRLWASLPTRETEEGSELIRMWQELCRARCWLGKCGDTWAFYYSSELVWNDHDHNTALFAGVLPFWIFSDVEALAHFLEVTHCSQAEIDFQPDGERDDLPEWTKKTRSLSPLIATFLDSPQLNQEGVATSSLDILNELNVLLIERAKVTYKLLDATVTDKEPLSSYLQIDEEEVTLWITLEADAGDYPDLIGDALQAYLGVAQIREFVSNLLEADTKKSRARVLSRWQKRGLRYQSLAGTEPGNNDGQIDNPQDEESEQPWQERGDEESAKRRSVANQQADYTRSPDEKGDVNSSHNTAPQNSENENPSDRNGSGAGGSHTTSGNNNPGSSSQGTGSYSAGRAGHRSSGSGNYGSAGGGGEGAEHKALKEKVALTPNLCGQNLSLIDSEYVLPSGDRVDVLLKNAEGVPIPVEIKPLINTGEYSNVWQAVKYKHLIATQQGVPCAQIRSILVAPNIPDDVKAKCLILGIDPIEISLP